MVAKIFLSPASAPGFIWEISDGLLNRRFDFG
jgi:hypothetical protein